ncbi:MAG: hypothetical protein OXB95_02605 [Rhodobacteraceae bacterium]|nr:hypothetical protein [Paracoccaceae bacterium]
MQRFPEAGGGYRLVEEFGRPDSAWTESATGGDSSPELHDRLRRSNPALNEIRLRQPPRPLPEGRRLRVASWNLERCKHVEATADKIRRTGAEIVLLSEMDIGMARSGNRDTIAELAELLDMGHASGVEFVELGLGDEREVAECSGMANRLGLHCNAVLSSCEFTRAEIVRLGAGGQWLAGRTGKGQPRVGGRIAVMVCVNRESPLWLVAVHFESEDGPSDRLREAELLVSDIALHCGDGPVVIGGDFNFNSLAAAGMAGDQLLASPEEHEPAFSLLRTAGFAWEAANTTCPTTRRHPWDGNFVSQKIDWFFVRGVNARNPQVIPACTSEDQNLSDHELLVADISW